MVKHEAIALVVRATDFFKVLQDTAFQLVHAVVADILHVDCCFFAAYATSAEGNDSFIVQRLFFALNDRREFAEFFDTVVNRVVEGADIDFEGIAGIQHYNGLALIIVALIQPAFECRGLDRRGAA